MRNPINYVLAPVRALISPFRFLFSWPARLIGVPSRMLGLSLPARVALIVAVVLCLSVGIWWYVHVLRERPPWPLSWALVPIILVVMAITVMAYLTVKLFLEGGISAFPDLDEAWEAGLAALRKNSLDLTKLPVFLLVGVHEGEEADRIMDATGMQFLARAVPEGRHPLRWYANERAVFLACPRLGCLSLAISGGDSHAVARGGPADSGDPSGTITIGVAPAVLSEEDDAMGASLSPGEFDAGGTLFGTLVAGVRTTLGMPGPAESPRGAATGARRADLEKQSRRLGHVGQLLSRARQPFCAFNGMLALIPWKIVQDTAVTPQTVAQALQLDAQSLQDATQLNFPITALVTGMETEPGFLELVRRVGHEYCQRRFGRGFMPTNRPTKENMEALAAHVHGVFEDFVYKLFRDPNGLKKPGNAQLYTLLCKVRTRLESRLTNVLKGFASDKPADRRILGGLYFAATGESSDDQCFLKGSIDKVLQLEEEVEWTEGAVQADRRYAGWAEIAQVLSALAAVSLAAVLFYQWLGRA